MPLRQLATAVDFVRVVDTPFFDGGQVQIYTEPSRSDAGEIGESSCRVTADPLTLFRLAFAQIGILNFTCNTYIKYKPIYPKALAIIILTLESIR